jgi:hypothetical protein
MLKKGQVYSSLRVGNKGHPSSFFLKQNIHIVATIKFENVEKLIIVNSKKIAKKTIETFPKLSKQRI